MTIWTPVFCLFLGVANAQWDAYTMGDRQVIVHLFEWKWKDIAKECENWLGPHGFAGVQVSPPNENLKIEPDHPWYERYQPIGYGLNTRSGNENEFKNMVYRCYKVGVRIYADAVINHMATNAPDGSEQYDFWRVPYSGLDFNYPQGRCPTPSGMDYGNMDSIRNCDLDTLKDLDLGKDYVRGKIAEYLNRLIGMGVAGFRFDAAKHMWPGDLKALYHRLKNLNASFGFPNNARPFVVQEVIDLGGEAVSSWEYLDIGRVTEFKYGIKLAEGFRRQNLLKWFKNFGEGWGLIPDYNSMVFVDNHDNQRGHGGRGGIITHKESRLYKMANAFMLAHPYGLARVMSSFGFTGTNISPPRDVAGNTASPVFHADNTCGNGWICEHLWRQIKNMVVFRRVTVGQVLANWWDNDGYQIAFGRGNKGFLVINNQDDYLSQTLQTGLSSGTYCNVILGDFHNGKCTGPTVYVDGNGYAKFDIAGSGNEDPVVAIHVGAKQEETMADGCRPCTPDDPTKAFMCVVCGDRANGMHYRALTCEGCKTFFRRNARKMTDLKCEMGSHGKCVMDLYMRRHCGGCRMKKCLEVGMQVDRLWAKERIKTRKPIIKKVRPAAQSMIKEKPQGRVEPLPVSDSTSLGLELPSAVSDTSSSSLDQEMVDQHLELAARIKAVFKQAEEQVATQKKPVPEEVQQNVSESLKKASLSRRKPQDEELPEVAPETGSSSAKRKFGGNSIDKAGMDLKENTTKPHGHQSVLTESDCPPLSSLDSGQIQTTPSESSLLKRVLVCQNQSHVDDTPVHLHVPHHGYVETADCPLSADQLFLMDLRSDTIKLNSVHQSNSPCLSCDCQSPVLCSPSKASPKLRFTAQQDLEGTAKKDELLHLTLVGSSSDLGHTTLSAHQADPGEGSKPHGPLPSLQSTQPEVLKSPDSIDVCPDLWSSPKDPHESLPARADDLGLRTGGKTEHRSSKLPMMDNGSRAEASSAEEQEGSEGEPEFDDMVFKHIMEIMVMVLKNMTTFAKCLPGFRSLTWEDQAAVVKGAYLEYLVLTSAALYNPETKSFISVLIPGQAYTRDMGVMGGLSKMANSITVFAEKLVKLELREEELALIFAICVMTPDRPDVKEVKIIATQQQLLVEALQTCMRMNHPGQNLFPRSLMLLTDVRDVTEKYMDDIMNLKLRGNSMLPLLNEMFNF